MGDDLDVDSNKRKQHRERLSGRKADKKKSKNEHVQELTDRQKNPKAFAINSAVRAERKFRRSEDLKRKKEHIPIVDRTPLEPPPIVIAVVGPPKVGKSLLVRALIKSYTRQPLTTIKGPVTVVSGKKRRITLIECNNDVNCMVDIAKVADLVLLLIDASFGFEMEIFEFLNICQVHGMPKVMGVLTHLDMIKQTKKMQKTKKILKHRFWKEVYPGAKLFYLSNLQHGTYLKNEVKNLARFISVMKFRPLMWQTTHPYVLADRMEDTTPPEIIQLNSKADRTVCFYGYMRGIPMNRDCFVHIPGCGDYGIADISFLPDPCPLPEHIKKRSLIDKERIIYAPFSGVGGIVYDKDAIYVDLPTLSRTEVRDNREHEMVSNLIEAKETIDSKLSVGRLQLFSDGEALAASDIHDSNNGTKDYKYKIIETDDKRKRKKVIFDEADIESDVDTENDEPQGTDPESDDDEDNGEKTFQAQNDNEIHNKINKALAGLEKKKTIDWSDYSSSDEENAESVPTAEKKPWDQDVTSESESELEDTDLNWKNNLTEKASQAFIERQSSKSNLWKLVYGEESTEKLEPEENVIGGLFKVVNRDKETIKNRDMVDDVDCSKYPVTQLRDWSRPEVIDSIKDCFVTGKWKKDEDADELLKLDDLSEPDELFGEFEDLETGEKFEGEKHEGKELTKEDLLEKKKKLKAKFDEEYDTKDGDENYFNELKTEANRQAEMNKNQFEGIDDSVRVQIEGYRAGMYVRIKIEKMPCEIVENFDPTYPLVVGGLQPGEQNVGYVKVRLKKHRWYNRILKTNDPLVISLGWRRFQTIVVYSKQEDNMRYRMLKYTPEHVACMGHFWGPTTRASTGILALLSAGGAEVEPGFRIVATGAVVDTDQSSVVMKKLKLIGEPLKIYKKTAFISGMFNSTLEVAKFEGAKIKTVSGIRGQIKKPLNKPEGAFRATFEDKIRASDIVFCRTWYKVDVPKFYTPVSSLLLPLSEKNTWKGMRTLGMIKREKGIRNEAQPDSMYTEIVRPQKVSRPLVIPRTLEKELPYKYKTKAKPVNKEGAPFMNSVRKVVVRDDHEAKVSSLMKKLSVNFRVRAEKERKDKLARIDKLKKRVQDEELRKMNKHRQIKKSVYRTLSKLEKRNDKSKSK